MRRDQNFLNSIRILLHWLTVVLLLLTWAAIEVAEVMPKGSDQRGLAHQVHYLSGFAVWLTLWPRVLMKAIPLARSSNPEAGGWGQWAAKWVHGLLYVFMLTMPLLGWLTLAAKGQTLSLGAWSLPVLLEPNRSLAHWLKELHEAGAAAGLVLIGVHAAAALFHHVVLKDDVMRRMLFRRSTV